MPEENKENQEIRENYTPGQYLKKLMLDGEEPYLASNLVNAIFHGITTTPKNTTSS